MDCFVRGCYSCSVICGADVVAADRMRKRTKKHDVPFVSQDPWKAYGYSTHSVVDRAKVHSSSMSTLRLLIFFPYEDCFLSFSTFFVGHEQTYRPLDGSAYGRLASSRKLDRRYPTPHSMSISTHVVLVPITPLPLRPTKPQPPTSLQQAPPHRLRHHTRP